MTCICTQQFDELAVDNMSLIAAIRKQRCKLTKLFRSAAKSPLVISVYLGLLASVSSGDVGQMVAHVALNVFNTTFSSAPKEDHPFPHFHL